MRRRVLMVVRAARRAPWLPGLSVSLAVAAVVVALQPVGGPWYDNADADATYTASGLNILDGAHTRYIDHPGLPLQELIAVSFGTRYLIGRAFGEHGSLSSYVDHSLLNLDSTRPYFRGWAIVFYLLGAVLSFLLVGRLFRSWAWGTVGGLFWATTTDLAPLSIQYRPDVLLAVLVLVIGYLAVEAFSRRDPVYYALAAATLGFAMTVKVTAAAMGAPLVLAALIRPPASGAWTSAWARSTRFVKRRLPIVLFAVLVWLAAAVALNVLGWPQHPSTAVPLVGEVVLFLLVLLGWTLLLPRTRLRALGRLVHPVLPLMGIAAAAGIALPATLSLGDGAQMIVSLKEDLAGRGATGSYPWFALPFRLLVSHYPVRETAVMLAIAVVAGIVGLFRRDAWPVIWATAAVVLGFLAWGRTLGNLYYFAPAYVVAIPAVLWLARRLGKTGLALAFGLAAAMLAVTFSHPVHREAYLNACTRKADALLAPIRSTQDAVLTTYYMPDVLYYDLVTGWVNHVPQDKVYRDLQPTAQWVSYAQAQHLDVRFYAGEAAIGVTKTSRIDIPGLGPQTVQPIAGGAACGVVRFVNGVRG